MPFATGTASRLLKYIGDATGKHYAFNEDAENSEYLNNPQRSEDSGQIMLHLAVLIPGQAFVPIFTDKWEELTIHEKAVWGLPVDDSFPGETHKAKGEGEPATGEDVNTSPLPETLPSGDGPQEGN